MDVSKVELVVDPIVFTLLIVLESHAVIVQLDRSLAHRLTLLLDLLEFYHQVILLL